MDGRREGGRERERDKQTDKYIYVKIKRVWSMTDLRNSIETETNVVGVELTEVVGHLIRMQEGRLATNSLCHIYVLTYVIQLGWNITICTKF